jgi:hypothetical protein
MELMNKIEVLRRLRAAKRSHLHWVSTVRGIVDGIPINLNSIAVARKKSSFGLWYYGEGQNLSGYPLFKDIESHHIEMYESFMKICLYLRGEKPKKKGKVPTWKKLLTKKESKRIPQPDKALTLYPKLKKSSDKVTKLLRELEEQINDLPRG